MTVSLNYFLSGYKELPTLILLHGFLGSVHDWQKIAERLSGTHRILAVDLPGHGQSLLSNENDYTFERTAKLIIEILDREKIVAADITGYSMGGRLALFLALRFSTRIRSITLISASPGLKTDQERHLRRAQDTQLRARLAIDPLETFIDFWYSQKLFASLIEHEEVFKAIRQSRLNNNAQGLMNSLKHAGTGAQPSLWPELPTIQMPVLLPVGEYDPKFIAIAEEMASLCPSAQLRIIQSAGHALPFEKPLAICESIEQFLDARH
ncbi:MAG: 2-succinyl-6-hydroxy-2,4-cyclohexadiene-1-carboxylate synthase [candidate division Zixibacteria bacterium]|nr:2-succinyl-6-hydroxy-2,4-cyclohexadiene-1-carboxylate synthase [candidate division Zixibacteria bacterium]